VLNIIFTFAFKEIVSRGGMQWKNKDMTESDYKNVLVNQKREMQIGMIVELHPVYKDFNFGRYSDNKIAEMYKVLVQAQQGGRNTEVQTKV
jgi:hypothetical protein